MTSTSQLSVATPPTASSVTPTGSSELTDQLLERARAIGPMLREQSDVAERERRLPKAVFDALGEAGFSRMLVPRSLGGLEVDPVTCARVVEEVASHDSAAAWSLQSGNVNAFFSARLPDDGVDELLGANPSTIVAAACHPPQQAIEVDGGFRVSGFVDCGNAGVADPYQDLALCARSVAYNFGPDFVPVLFAKYGLDSVDEAKLAYCNPLSIRKAA